MDEPSKAANRILLGTGFGLILVCGFAIIEERMVVNELGFGHLFFLIGVLCLVMSKLLDYEPGRSFHYHYIYKVYLYVQLLGWVEFWTASSCSVNS